MLLLLLPGYFLLLHTLINSLNDNSLTYVLLLLLLIVKHYLSLSYPNTPYTCLLSIV